MTPHLSDRQRVELALPARLMRRCWAGIIEGHKTHDAPVKESHLALLDDLRKCCEEALAGLPPREAEKLRARIDRAATHALLPYERDALMKTTLMVLYWVRDRLDAGDLTLFSGSLFESCFERLHHGLAEHSDLWEGVNKSAAKHAIKLHERLMEAGYFQARRAA